MRDAEQVKQELLALMRLQAETTDSQIRTALQGAITALRWSEGVDCAVSGWLRGVITHKA